MVTVLILAAIGPLGAAAEAAPAVIFTIGADARRGPAVVLYAAGLRRAKASVTAGRFIAIGDRNAAESGAERTQNGERVKRGEQS